MMMSVAFLGGCAPEEESVVEKDVEDAAPEAVMEEAVEPIVVEFWPWWLGTFDGYLNDMIAEFEAENPNIKIEMTNVDGDISVTLLTAIVAGEGPDIVNLNNPTAATFFNQGALAALDLHSGGVDLGAEFIDDIWESTSFDGVHHYAFPWYSSPQIMIYNKEIFEQAGLDPEDPPQTWEEVLEFSRKIKQETGKFGFAVPVRSWEMIQRVGEQVFNEDLSAVAFNTPRVARRLDFFRTARAEGLMPGHLPDFQEARTMFEAGKVAMYPVGVSMVKHIETNSPELAKNLGFGRFPTCAHEDGVVRVNAPIMNLAVLECSDVKEAAVKWGQFLSGHKAQVEFAKVATVVPSTKIGLEIDSFFVESDSLGVQAQLVASKAMAYASDLSLTSTPEGWQEMQDLLADGFREIITGDGNIQKLLDNLEYEINEIIAELN